MRVSMRVCFKSFWFASDIGLLRVGSGDLLTTALVQLFGERNIHVTYFTAHYPNFASARFNLSFSVAAGRRLGADELTISFDSVLDSLDWFLGSSFD
jgi:hypothetical protein